MRWIPALSLLLASAAWPQLAEAKPSAAGPLQIPHEEFTLENGLRVVLAPDHSAPIVHTQVWYHVGSKDEVAGRTGFAHLFEHLMFQGSKNTPGEYFTPIQEVGGTLNGTTNTDRTNYFETVPSRYLPLALFMEADRMGALLDVFDLAKLDNQRDVVKNERRQRYENPPYGLVWVDLSASMYPEGHPYHHATIGSHEDLAAASVDDVSGFFRTWYVPNNATLVVAGDFDPAAARAMVTEQFGWIPSGPTPVHATAAPVRLAETQKIVQHRPVPDRKVWIGWHSAAAFQPGDAEMDIASNLLCDGQDSRLYRRLVERDQIARDISCSQMTRRLGGMFLVEATAAEGHTTDEIVAAIDSELAQVLGAAPPTADEVSSAITSYKVGAYYGLQTIQGKASTMSGYMDLLGKPDAVQEDLNRYLKLKPSKVLKALKLVIDAPRVELHVLPEADAPAGGAP